MKLTSREVLVVAFGNWKILQVPEFVRVGHVMDLAKLKRACLTPIYAAQVKRICQEVGFENEVLDYLDSDDRPGLERPTVLGVSAELAPTWWTGSPLGRIKGLKPTSTS